MGTALIIGIPILVVLVAIVVFASARRGGGDTQGRRVGALSGETRASDSSAVAVSDDASDAARARADEAKVAAGGLATRSGSRVAEYTPAEYEEIQVSRRQFFNRSIITTMSVSVGTFGLTAIAFLYAKSAGGFGGKVDAGISLPDLEAYWESKKEPYYVPEARTYLQPYPKSAVPNAKKIPEYALVLPNMEQGVIGVYQKCVHLGCRVPWCQTSQWFECPCHGSKYNRVGEFQGGPAPRGLDQWVVTVSGSKVSIDTGGVAVTGAPLGTNTTDQGAEGPPCV